MPYWRYLNFNIFNIGFRFWIYEYIKVVFTMKYNTYYRRFNATIKSSGQLLWPTASTGMLIDKVNDDACQWNGHDVVISIGGIFFYRTLCMLHDTRRNSEPSVTLKQRFPPLCTRLLFVVSTLMCFSVFVILTANYLLYL